MKGRTIPMMLAGGFLVLVFAAWFDGGEEPLRTIEQDIPVPDGVS